jgi:hypothetical protein
LDQLREFDLLLISRKPLTDGREQQLQWDSKFLFEMAQAEKKEKFLAIVQKQRKSD